MESVRYRPNIIISGTPGCGKSTTCELLRRRVSDEYKYFNISDFAKEKDCYDGYDEARKSHIVDEDRLLDELEPLLRKGGCIVDWHVNDIFPERLIDLVVVLRCDNAGLYDRLKKRGYHDAKIDENLDAEIMGVVLQDALDSYAKEIVVELQSDTTEDMDKNVDRIAAWLDQWLEQHEDGVTNELEGAQEGESDGQESQEEEEEEESQESQEEEED